MIGKIKQLYYKLGWKTSRKLIVFASDDWGSIRVASVQARENLKAKGFNMDSNRFNQFDALESGADMAALFDVLSKHKDHNGNPAVFTALTNVANPDFQKIEASGFRAYHYQPFTTTLQSYPEHVNVYTLYKQGIDANIFRPEFHGREHLNVNRWMNALQSGNKNALLAFEQGFYLPDRTDMLTENAKNFGPAFDVDVAGDVIDHEKIVTEGLELFESLFGYKATLFTAPAQVYNTGIEKALANGGVKLLDVPAVQNIPTGHGKQSKKLRFTGKKNKLGQRYITRNAVFEPNMNDADNGVNSCLSDIESAFKMKKPAIISNHRAAFSGGISAANRDKGIKALDELLTAILKRWPDAEFISAAELNRIMSNA
ncbi:MAG: polysaccharide (de)acetylase [Flavobacterium sp.]